MDKFCANLGAVAQASAKSGTVRLIDRVNPLIFRPALDDDVITPNDVVTTDKPDSMICALGDQVHGLVPRDFAVYVFDKADFSSSDDEFSAVWHFVKGGLWHFDKAEGTRTTIWILSKGEVSVLMLVGGKGEDGDGKACILHGSDEGKERAVKVWQALASHPAAPQWARGAKKKGKRSQHADPLCSTLALSGEPPADGLPGIDSAAWSAVLATARFATTGLSPGDKDWKTIEWAELECAQLMEPLGIWLLPPAAARVILMTITKDDLSQLGVLAQMMPIAPTLPSMLPLDVSSPVHSMFAKAASTKCFEIFYQCLTERWHEADQNNTPKIWPCCQNTVNLGSRKSEQLKPADEMSNIRKHFNITTETYSSWPPKEGPTKACGAWYHAEAVKFVQQVLYPALTCAASVQGTDAAIALVTQQIKDDIKNHVMVVKDNNMTASTAFSMVRKMQLPPAELAAFMQMMRQEQGGSSNMILDE
jgi:hypothetical protein